MVHVWVGKLSLEAAVRSERIGIIGPRQLRELLRRWFLYSPIHMNTLSNPLLTAPSSDQNKVFSEFESSTRNLKRF